MGRKSLGGAGDVIAVGQSVAMSIGSVAISGEINEGWVDKHGVMVFGELAV